MKRWDDWYNIIVIIANMIGVFSVIGVVSVIITIFKWFARFL